ncbi:MAG: hypothetical protein EZS28_023352, partial [Streblomastix strix]
MSSIISNASAQAAAAFVMQETARALQQQQKTIEENELNNNNSNKKQQVQLVDPYSITGIPQLGEKEERYHPLKWKQTEEEQRINNSNNNGSNQTINQNPNEVYAVYIGGFPPETTKKAAMDYAQTFGNFRKFFFSVPRDKDQTLYAFVDYINSEDAKKALNSNGKIYESNTMAVVKAANYTQSMRQQQIPPPLPSVAFLQHLDHLAEEKKIQIASMEKHKKEVRQLRRKQKKEEELASGKKKSKDEDDEEEDDEDEDDTSESDSDDNNDKKKLKLKENIKEIQPKKIKTNGEDWQTIERKGGKIKKKEEDDENANSNDDVEDQDQLQQGKGKTKPKTKAKQKSKQMQQCFQLKISNLPGNTKQQDIVK